MKSSIKDFKIIIKKGSLFTKKFMISILQLKTVHLYTKTKQVSIFFISPKNCFYLQRNLQEN